MVRVRFWALAVFLSFLFIFSLVSVDNTNAQENLGSSKNFLELETIMVTAKKWETNLQETPISITALTSQQIQPAD